MASYTVTHVRKETSDDGSHRHIEGVCTTASIHYTRKDVVVSINQGNLWETLAEGKRARIDPIEYCPRPACIASPYIRTVADASAGNNLENLPEC